jgi:hypothetical protein
VGDGSEVPLVVMVKCVTGDNIREDLARNEERSTVSASSVEGVEEDPLEDEDIGPISRTQDTQEVHEEACHGFPGATLAVARPCQGLELYVVMLRGLSSDPEACFGT